MYSTRHGKVTIPFCCRFLSYSTIPLFYHHLVTVLLCIVHSLLLDIVVCVCACGGGGGGGGGGGE